MTISCDCSQKARVAELHSDVLNAALPPTYSTLLPLEASTSLVLALDGLRAAANVGDMQRSAPFHCSALRRFIQLKHHIPDEVRTQAIHLIYNIVTADIDLAFGMRKRWCGLLCKLLRRAKHLTLTLPWRPLFNLILTHCTSKLRVAVLQPRSASQSHLSSLSRCVAQCRRHFAAGSTVEILHAVEPMLCPKDPQVFTGAALLSLFLPTHGAEGTLWQPRLLSLWRGSGVEGCIEWELLFMLLFKRLAKDAFFGRAAPVVAWEELMPIVFSRTLLLLHLPGGTGQVAPKGCAFSTVASTLIPCQWPPPLATLRAAARIVVLSLPPLPRAEARLTAEVLLTAESQGPEAAEAAAAVEAAEEAEAAEEISHITVGLARAGLWERLRQLLRCAEPYCHPSNTGPWCSLIGYLLQALAQYLSWRVLHERASLAADEAGALAEGDLSVLVRLLIPLFSRALYSKAVQLMLMSQMAVRYLSDLCPDIVLPSLLVRLCDGLQAVTATHQTPMALQTLTLLTPQLVELTLVPAHDLDQFAKAGPYPLSASARRALASGPRVLHEMLHLALRGIDANDPDKTSATMRLFQQLLLFVPLAGTRWADHSSSLSRSAAGASLPAEMLERMGLCEREKLCAKLRAAGDVDGLLCLEEQEREAIALCSWLPEFARELLAQLISTLEHFEKSSEGGRDAHRQSIHLFQWRRLAMLFFSQLAEDVYDELVPQLLSLIRRPSLIDAVKQVGSLLSSAARAAPEAFLARALPVCFGALLKHTPPTAASTDELLACLSEESVDDGLLQPLLESELRWYLQVLSHIIRACGAALLPYLPALHLVLRLTRLHDEREVVEANAKLRRRLLQAFSSTYVVECRSLPPELWRSLTVRKQPWRVWGWRPPLNPAADRVRGLGPSWHVPNAVELSVVAVLTNTALTRAESFGERLRELDTVVQASSKPDSNRDPSAVANDTLRACLLELHALSKGVMPYLADEPGESIKNVHYSLFETAQAVFDQPVSESADGLSSDSLPASASTSVSRQLPPRPTPPQLRSVIAHAGRALLPDELCYLPQTRLCNTLVVMGVALAPRETVRNLVLLLSVASTVVSERVSNQAIGTEQQMLHLSRRSCTMRGGGRPKFQPRANLLSKLAIRHSCRLSATSFGAAWRTPALRAVIKLQLDLSTHAYSSVRTEAQSGFNAAIRSHPWLARAHLPSQISLMHAPSAEPHQTKGAIFLLSARAVLKRAASDPAIFGTLIHALVCARDHNLAKLQQRARNLLSAVCESSPFPLPPFSLKPLALAGSPVVMLLQARGMKAEMSGDDAVPELDPSYAASIAKFYDWVALRDKLALEEATTALLTLASPATVPAVAGAPPTEKMEDGPPSALQHWAKEVAALCGLVILPIVEQGHRSAVAACAVRGLVSPIAAVRKLSRSVVSMLLTRPRWKGVPTLIPAKPPADVLAPLSMTDTDWEATAKQEKLVAGWASKWQYSASKLQGENGSPRVTVLGDVADALLADPAFIRIVLQWLVADHKEADTDDHGGHDLFRQPHDVVISLLSPSRRWPSQPGHGVEFKDFELRHAQLFKGLASYYGASKTAVALLPEMLPLLADGKRDAQAVAAETFGGLVRGAGHWQLSEQRALWDQLRWPLRAALRACSVQSLGDWQACVRYMAFNRDPRRVAWLADLLLSELEGSTLALSLFVRGGGAAEGSIPDLTHTSLMQANHLRFISPLLVELSWRAGSLIPRLLKGDVLRQWVSHPYRQVREEVGSLIAIVMDACTPLPYHQPAVGQAIRDEVDSFVEHLIAESRTPEIGSLSSSSSGSSVAVADSADCTAAADLALEPQDALERDLARAARETTLRVITHSAMQARAYVATAYTAQLLPSIMCAAASMQRPDLSNAAKACAVLMAHFPYEPGQFQEMQSVMHQLSSAPSWRLRGGLLPMSALLAYRGQFIEPLSSHASTMRSILQRLLADPQHEVREATAVVLAGFIRLRGSTERTRMLTWARQHTKRSRSLTDRHAGVLALVALLQLAPYDVPSWLPEVLELLGSFHNEPQPIKATVSKAFADFKRTHQDNWASHRERFTPGQQDLISDMLVSPSFYA